MPTQRKAKFAAIAAMSENRVIGNKGQIPWHISEDFRWFKHKTMGGTLIMGRKTFESMGEPLPGRKTIILSRSPKNIPGVESYRDLETLPSPTADHSALWICGGAEIYQQFLPRCAMLYLTRVKKTVEGDTFFPPFEQTYTLDRIIHDTPEFRVERWLNQNEPGQPSFDPPPDNWPFEERGS